MARPAGEPGPTSTATASTDDAGNPATPNLQEYADLTSDREWPWIYRMLVCQLLRDLHAAPADALRSIVEQEPGLKTWDDWHVLLNVADAGGRVAPDPLAGVHVAVGAPEDRRTADGHGLPFTETAWVRPCRSYRAGGMAYVGYGVDGRDGIGVDRNRSWGGFSGAPVWRLEPRPEVLDKLSRGRGDVSIGDFQNARPVAILCHRNAGAEGLGPPEGFTHEVYAHRIDARFLRIAARLLSFEDRDDNRVRRVTERHVR